MIFGRNISSTKINLKVFLKCLIILLFVYYFLYYTGIIKTLTQITAASIFGQFFPGITIKNHFLIYSTIYYNVSKLYSSDSMLIVLNTHRNTPLETMNFTCVSKNDTNTVSSPLQIRMTHHTPAKNCQWEAFIANCSTVSNPKYFGVKSNESTNAVEMKYEIPVSEKYPVIMCYTPLVYEARWQQLIFATEIYHYFGADMQVQYVNSAMKQIIDILRIYEKKKWVKIQEFVYYDFGSDIVKSIGFHPSKETISRNQLTAQADCMMRYREASEFIISADIDDILFPQEKDYYSEFSKWNTIYPDAGAFIYPRSYAKIDTSNEYLNFSIASAIESLKISNATYMGKPILKTNQAETPWIHWSGLSNGRAITLDAKEVVMLHVQIAEEKIRNVNNFYSFGEKQDLNALKPYTPISKDQIETIHANFVSSFKNVTNFVSNFVYADIIFDCFKESEHWNQDYCYTQFRCRIPSNVTNFECNTVRRNISANFLKEKSVAFYLPTSNYYWINSKDNCKIFGE